MSAKYINPKLPSMIRNLHKGDPSMNSVKTMLGLAADLVQELIDLRAEQAETEDERAETLTGEIRGLAFEDGEPHGIYCGLDECGCPDHDDPPRPAGTYITVRLDGEPPVGLWRVQVRRIPVPDTTNETGEDQEQDNDCDHHQPRPRREQSRHNHQRHRRNSRPTHRQRVR